jgi:hypothetical protein
LPGYPWSIGWSVGWLVCLLVGWFVCLFVGWLVGWLVGWFVGWLVGWRVVGWLVGGWLVGAWVVGWTRGWLVGWLVCAAAGGFMMSCTKGERRHYTFHLHNNHETLNRPNQLTNQPTNHQPTAPTNQPPQPPTWMCASSGTGLTDGLKLKRPLGPMPSQSARSCGGRLDSVRQRLVWLVSGGGNWSLLKDTCTLATRKTCRNNQQPTPTDTNQTTHPNRPHLRVGQRRRQPDEPHGAPHLCRDVAHAAHDDLQDGAPELQV